MAKLTFYSCEGAQIDLDKGELTIKNLKFIFDKPKESPSLDVDLKEAIELTLEAVRKGVIEPGFIN